MIAFYVAAAVVAGALVTPQTGSNAKLKEALGAPIPGVIVSSGARNRGAARVVVAHPDAGIPSTCAAPWSAWLGGLLGAVYAVTVVLLARRPGAATLSAAAVTGQLVCSVVLDHFGLIGFELHLAGPAKILGCVLMAAGLALI